MGPRQAHLIYEFGDYRLDALRRVLSSRVDGEAIPVTGKVFDALLYFVERAGQLLDKRQLMDALWPNVVVEESNLTQTVHTLRRLLGERPEEHRFIVTVPGRGYRFVADVRQVTETAEAVGPRPRRRRLLALVPVSIALAAAALFLLLRSPEVSRPPSPDLPIPSIAVLPFVDMSPEQDQTYFADGLSEEILNVLAQSPALRVIARTSSFSFKDQRADIATIADKLDVTHVLEGSVRKAGERIRVTAQLVDAANSAHLWSHTYDGDLTEVFRVQTDIAAAVAEALQITLSGAAHATRGEATVAQAYERFLQGRYFFNRRGPSDLERARDYFEQALRIDPGYARAWAGLAGFYFVNNEEEPMPEHTARKWQQAVENAVRFGPNVSEAHMRAAQYYWETGNTPAADAHFKRALALNPSDLLVLGTSSSRAVLAGNMHDAISLWRRAAAVDPLSATTRGNLGLHLMAVGQLQDAKAEIEKALELSNAQLELNADLVKILLLEKRFAEALALIERVPEGPSRDQCHALVHHAMGRAEAADAALGRLLASESANPRARVRIFLAEVYAFRGERDEAFRWLKRVDYRARQGRSVTPGWWIPEELVLSALLKPLHTDPRWPSLLAKPGGAQRS